MTGAQALAAFGVALAAAGLALLATARAGAATGRFRLAGVGPLSRVTLGVVGLSLIGAGYHVAVHALGVMRDFRAPLPIALIVAIVAILGSIGVDAMENRSRPGPPRQG
jgi:hypothetical protein